MDLNELNPWFYKLNIGGEWTHPGIGTDYDEEFLTNRQTWRKTLIIDSWANEERVKGRSVLDIACNAGYWSYCLYELGARWICGIEGRDLFVRQANLFFKGNKVDCNYRFHRKNVADLETFDGLEDIDIVLCCGILYHIPNWEEVLRVLCGLTREVLVVDTRVAEEDKQKQEKPHYFNAIYDTSLKRVPVREELLGVLAREFGFGAKVVKPRFPDMKGLSKSDSYNEGRRLCIICER